MYLDARRQPPADLLKLHIYKSSGGYTPLILLKVTNIHEAMGKPSTKHPETHSFYGP